MNLQTRTFLTVLFSAAMLVVLLALGLKLSMDRGLVEYLNSKQKVTFAPVVQMLEDLYERDGNWNEVRSNPDRYDAMVRSLLPRNQSFPGGSLQPPHRPDRQQRPGPGHPQPPDRRMPGPGPEGRRPLPPGQDTHPSAAPAVRLLDVDKSLIAGPVLPFRESINIRLQARNKHIGWLNVPGADPVGDDFELDVIKVVQESLVLLLLVLFVVALLATTLMVRPLVQSLRQIAVILHRFADRQYLNVEVPARQDEIGQVYRDLSQLGETLSEAETMRQRWFANISHELRTPLTVMKSEVEAMQDGVRPLNREQVQILADQINQLHHLVNDLSDLANAEAGSLRFRKEVADIAELISTHEPQWQLMAANAGLLLSVSTTPEVLVWADAIRIQQVLDNLLANACKYTEVPGQIRLSLTTEYDQALIVTEDSAPGVSQADQTRLFDYLYRADSSRNRDTGGSGLGLGIVQRIVEGHDGRVSVRDSVLGGLCVEVRFPLFNDNSGDNEAGQQPDG
ncbi:MAG: hypothetical protein KDI36_19060 [Pseudomonadales bacterium]|nr:hypothetical protein [Pseudomonadales bacterium]